MASPEIARALRLPLALALAAGVGACVTAPPTRYAWGGYEAQLYVLQAKPGTLTPEAQADQLEKDRQAARSGNKPLPPGWHAHLAAVYFELGRGELAREELLAEKTAFPESTTLVDRMIANMTKPPSPATPASPASPAGPAGVASPAGAAGAVGTTENPK